MFDCMEKSITNDIYIDRMGATILNDELRIGNYNKVYVDEELSLKEQLMFVCEKLGFQPYSQ